MRWLPLLLLLAAPAQAAPTTVDDSAVSDSVVDEVEVFSLPSCPHCAAAKRWLGDMAQDRVDLRLVVHDIAADPAQRARLQALAEAQGVTQVGVPAFLVAGTLVVGFDDATTTGAQLLALIDGQAVHVDAQTCAADPDDPCAEPTDQPSTIDLPLVGTVDPATLGLPLFTFLIGAIDGLNPCATWVLLFVLSLLVNLKSRARMLAVGGTFVLVSGLTYFAFMEAWLSFYLLVGITRPVQVVLGLVALAVGAVHIKDFFAFHKGVSLSIPEAAKPGIVKRARNILRAESLAGAMGAAFVLAVMVNIVELLCTAGLPAVYTEILVAHDLPRWQHHAYLGLYNLVYMLDDAVLLTIATVTLSKRKLQEKGGRWLKLLSGLVMALLGLLLLAWPEALRW